MAVSNPQCQQVIVISSDTLLMAWWIFRWVELKGYVCIWVTACRIIEEGRSIAGVAEGEPAQETARVNHTARSGRDLLRR